jgi:hypothetical protein
MQYRTIPIRSSGCAALPVPALASAPRLEGESGRTRLLLDELEQAVAAELGAPMPVAAWLRTLRVDDDEAVLTLAPMQPHPGLDIAQAAFATLRRLLRDTDIYVGAAAH